MTSLVEQMMGSIVGNLAEGLLIIKFDGTIIYANEAAFSILGISREEMMGGVFASVFLKDPRNDDFVQTVLDAIYSKTQCDAAVVPYYDGDKVKHLRVVASYLTENGKTRIGLTLVIGDLSEIIELEDAVKAMEYIEGLNRQLEDRNRLLSKTFGMFLSDEIVSHLLESPEGLALGGDKKVVTIMMSDLRGFTAISERMEAGALISMLNHYLGVMTDVIQSRGGTIIEFIGDGIMAIFGAPTPSQTHAADAVAAALEMQKAMEEINRWNAGRHYPILEMGIGLDTGEVIIGNIGSEKRMKYGAVGSHVNHCGRIESYTVGGQVLISTEVRDNIDADLEIAMEMTVMPKGVEEEVVLTQVVGIGQPYNVSVSVKKENLKDLQNPVPVRFFRMEGKHTLDTACYGGIVSVGRDNARLETQTDLKLFDNIQISAGGKLLAKVMMKDEKGYMLQYTYIPSGYDRWIKKAVAER